jgi:hypothetical protein
MNIPINQSKYFDEMEGVLDEKIKEAMKDINEKYSQELYDTLKSSLKDQKNL